jgi:hypothetical protein
MGIHIPKLNVSALSKSRPRPQGSAPATQLLDSISTGHTLRTQNLSSSSYKFKKPLDRRRRNH